MPGLRRLHAGAVGGICPVTRCAKRLLNGPCGGSREERCEVDADRLDAIVPPKDWPPSRHSGARKIVREEHMV